MKFIQQSQNKREKQNVEQKESPPENKPFDTWAHQVRMEEKSKRKKNKGIVGFVPY